MSAVRTSQSQGRELEKHGRPARSYFLELPLELRQNIYSMTLCLSLTEQLSLLSTSKQICEEGHEFIFQRPLTCSSRLRLQTFVDSHPPSVLNQIRSLRLRLEEPAPAAMQSYLRNAIMGIPVQASDHPYVTESEAVLSCLRTMPNVKNFSLLPPHESNGTSAPRELVQYLLTKLPQYLQQLKFLSISTEIKSLDFLIGMPQLSSLRFSGCSEADPQSTCSIMKQMTHMQEFAIIGPSTTFLKRQKCRQKGVISAFTPDVLCNIQPLEKLTIRDLSPAGSPILLTTDTLTAIFDTHRSTLRSLCISGLSQPGFSVLERLRAVTTNMPILRELHVELPNVSLELVSDSLPSTIQSLTLAVQCRAHAQDMIEQLTLLSGRLPHLRNLHFNLVDALPEDTTGEKQRQGPAMPVHTNTGCNIPHWRITWGTWQPAGDEDP